MSIINRPLHGDAIYRTGRDACKPSNNIYDPLYGKIVDKEGKLPSGWQLDDVIRCMKYNLCMEARSKLPSGADNLVTGTPSATVDAEPVTNVNNEVVGDAGGGDDTMEASEHDAEAASAPTPSTTPYYEMCKDLTIINTIPEADLDKYMVKKEVYWLTWCEMGAIGKKSPWLMVQPEKKSTDTRKEQRTAGSERAAAKAKVLPGPSSDPGGLSSAKDPLAYLAGDTERARREVFELAAKLHATQLKAIQLNRNTKKELYEFVLQNLGELAAEPHKEAYIAALMQEPKTLEAHLHTLMNVYEFVDDDGKPAASVVGGAE